ncbi:MAG: hypothetical protein AB7P22_20480, partial [Vicinamibacterales bacterium]
VLSCWRSTIIDTLDEFIASGGGGPPLGSKSSCAPLADGRRRDSFSSPDGDAAVSQYRAPQFPTA